MATEWIQNQISRLLEEAARGVSELEWELVRDRAQAALALDPENADGLALVAAAERALGGRSDAIHADESSEQSSAPTPTAEHPTSFLEGRYQVKRFLGEGGKKRVYLAHDTTLDRDVAFALVKTEGLDDAGRTRGQHA